MTTYEQQPHEFRVPRRPDPGRDEGRAAWFVVRDVCEVLEVGNPTDAVKRLDQDDLDSNEVTDALGRSQATNVVNESGLYDLVLGSRKPEAKAFKRWVTHEVLPSIRRNGMYAVPSLLDDPEHLLKVTQRLVEERRARLAAEAQIEEDKPKVDFFKRVTASEDCIEVGEFAKLVGAGEIRFYRWLRDEKIVFRDGNVNVPYQEYVDSGYLRLDERVRTDKNGEHPYRVTVITGKGQAWLYKRWAKTGNAIQLHFDEAM